jgi:hypothetical protein
MTNFAIYCRYGTEEQAMTTMEQLRASGKLLQWKAGRRRKNFFSDGALSIAKESQGMRMEYLPAICSATIGVERSNIALNHRSR